MNYLEDHAIVSPVNPITIFGNRRLFHDFETIWGCGFQIKGKEITKIYSIWFNIVICMGNTNQLGTKYISSQWETELDIKPFVLILRLSEVYNKSNLVIHVPKPKTQGPLYTRERGWTWELEERSLLIDGKRSLLSMLNHSSPLYTWAFN
jgi:hypothetical protein